MQFFQIIGEIVQYNWLFCCGWCFVYLFVNVLGQEWIRYGIMFNYYVIIVIDGLVVFLVGYGLDFVVGGDWNVYGIGDVCDLVLVSGWMVVVVMCVGMYDE